VFRTRKDELSASKLHTILSQRDYRSDACYTVAVWQTDTSGPYSLEQLVDALRKPRLTLYLGRKACPPALPLEPQLCEAKTLKSAFEQANFHNDLIAALPAPQTVTYLWESHPQPGLSALQVYPRRDNPLSRLRWQFTPRDEYHAMEEAHRPS
jgi:CRISPR system Cascade subunit CasD